MSLPGEEGRPLTLREVRRILDGVIPPSICSVSADGVPHVNLLSHAEYVDDEHIALSFQFFNRSRENILSTGRVALMAEDPFSGAGVEFQLRYERTDTEGPVFERLRAKLAGIAAHSGMEQVFRLRGADVYRVLQCRRMQQVETLPVLRARCDLAAGARAVSVRLAECEDAGTLLQTAMDGLGEDLRVEHAILWLLDERRGVLFAIASRGYAHAGIGAELPMGDAGLAGVALREGVPIRIGHMARMYRYGRTLLEQAQGLGIEAAMRAEIPLPGLETPCSQLAVPLRARGRTLGVLLVESESDQFFGYDDEDALTLLCGQLAQALSSLQPEEAEPGSAPPAGDPFRSAASTVPASAANASAGSAAAPLRIRHYGRDDSVFVDDTYLIKGVAGAILWKVAGDAVTSGRTGFTSRELRLSGRRLRLPDVQDNLAVRLLLLQRRLADWGGPLQIRRVGRGQYELVADRPLVLFEES